MNMIWHAVDLQEFMSLVLYNSRHVLVQFIFPFILYEPFSVVHGKYNVDMDLGIGVSHGNVLFHMSYRTARNNLLENAVRLYCVITHNTSKLCKLLSSYQNQELTH